MSLAATWTIDPRGPVRRIVALDKRTDGTRADLDCGHTADLNQIFHYRVGDEQRCIRCRRGGLSGGAR